MSLLFCPRVCISEVRKVPKLLNEAASPGSVVASRPAHMSLSGPGRLAPQESPGQGQASGKQQHDTGM